MDGIMNYDEVAKLRCARILRDWRRWAAIFLTGFSATSSMQA
jgi:hypothetical protein